MNNLTIAAILISLTLPALAAGKITVAQLEQLVTAAHSISDKAAAEQIGALILSERISNARLEKMESQLPGPESKSALDALACAAQFLDLPSSDIPQTPPPSIDQQRAIVLRAVQFAADNLHQMPDLLATRKTVEYLNVEYAPQSWTSKMASDNAARPDFDIQGPFRTVGSSQAAMVYRNGHEEFDHGGASASPRTYRVINRGAFGEFLRLVMTDMIQSSITFSHWEQDRGKTLAVFRYSVPKGKANYQWTYCCTDGPGGKRLLVQDPAAYRAELAIDPQTGAVMRLVVKTDPDSNVILKASEAVEYGPVDIGERQYFCPVKDVVLFITRDYDAEAGNFAVGEQPDFLSTVRSSNTPFLSVALNHASFDNYHVFRSNVQILSSDDQIAPPAGQGTGNSQTTNASPPN